MLICECEKQAPPFIKQIDTVNYSIQIVNNSSSWRDNEINSVSLKKGPVKLVYIRMRIGVTSLFESLSH